MSIVRMSELCPEGFRAEVFVGEEIKKASFFWSDVPGKGILSFDGISLDEMNAIFDLLDSTGREAKPLPKTVVEVHSVECQGEMKAPSIEKLTSARSETEKVAVVPRNPTQASLKEDGGNGKHKEPALPVEVVPEVKIEAKAPVEQVAPSPQEIVASKEATPKEADPDEELVKLLGPKTNLQHILEIFLERGVPRDVDALTSACQKVRNRVKFLQKMTPETCKSRIPKTLEMMDSMV